MNGSKNGRCLAILIVLGAVQLVVGCQGGYPIPATHCDRWCDLQKAACSNYDPAGCVAFCEGESPSAAACDSEWDALFDCLEMNSSEIKCLDSTSNDGYVEYTMVCMDEQAALGNCRHPHRTPTPSDGE